MKRLRFCFALPITLLFILAISLPVYANMAAPEEPDIGTAITFEKNDDIAVRSEVLDIDVDGAVAYITATYSMENTTGEAVSTPAMFVAPNMDGGSVTIDGADAPFTAQSYALTYSTEIASEDWKYAVLSDDTEPTGQTVDTITFTLDFAPEEAYDVTVSYTYHLGGWPSVTGGYSSSRTGEITYYLAPAAMWKDFESLTINLHLDGNLPKITSSSLDFEKVGQRSYQYVSDTLPAQNLTIELGPNGFTRFWGELGAYLSLFAPLLFLLIIILLVVLLFHLYHKK